MSCDTDKKDSGNSCAGCCNNCSNNKPEKKIEIVPNRSEQSEK